MMSSAFPCDLRRAPVSRRNFLWELGGGLGGVALTALLAEEQARAAATAGTNPLGAKPPMVPAKARAVIQIFCPGGLSHLDTFDYKPELEKRAGTPFDPTGKLQFFASKPGNCAGSFWKFRQHGECGRWVSDLFPRLAGLVDEMAFIHSMQSKTALHGPAMFMANSGFILPGFPSMGAWVTYGLGSVAEDLPAFVVLPDPRGLPPGGPSTGARASCQRSTRARSSRRPRTSSRSPISFHRRRMQASPQASRRAASSWPRSTAGIAAPGPTTANSTPGSPPMNWRHVCSSRLRT